MIQSGTTTDNKPVLSGIGKLTTTHGIPLEIALYRLQQTGKVVDWLDYIATCKKDGHNPATIKSRILAAVEDVYGATYLKGFSPRLEQALGDR